MSETEPNSIVDGVRRAIAEHGPRGATMERIAVAMGVSRMTLHRRGLSREAIIAALRDEMAREERDAQWPAITAPGSAADRLELALRALCGVTEANLDAARGVGHRGMGRRVPRGRGGRADPAASSPRRCGGCSRMASPTARSIPAAISTRRRRCSTTRLAGRTATSARATAGGAQRAEDAVVRLALNGVTA